MPKDHDDRGPQPTGEVLPQPNELAWKKRKPEETTFGQEDEEDRSLRKQRAKNGSPTALEATGSAAKDGESVVLGLWGVRYQVKDVSRSVAFYTDQLGFTLDKQNLPAFAQVSVGNLKLILSGPGASGSRPMPGGHQQEPGGWNRVILQVADLPARIAALKNGGLHFRNDMEVGPGGKQIQLEDPDGNPIELFEPAR